MRQKTTFLACLILCLVCSNPLLADHSAHSVSRELAHILINFNHHAKPTERSTLANIMRSSRASDREKELAHIMFVTQQHVDTPSRQRLLNITQDATLNPLLRELAHVFLKLEKHASEEDRRYLKILLRRQSGHYERLMRQQMLSREEPRP